MDQPIFLSGGYQLSNDTTSRSIYEMDLRSRKWQLVETTTRQHTTNSAMAYRDNELFTVSGHGINGEFEGYADKFSISQRKWNSCKSVLNGPAFVADLIFLNNDPAAVGEPMLLTYDEKNASITISAGGTPYRSHFAVLSWDNDTLTPCGYLPDVSEIRTCCTTRSLFLAGGFNEKGMALTNTYVGEVQNSSLDLKPIRPMSIPRGHYSLVALPDSIVAVGGTARFGSRVSYSSCEMYDLCRDAWTFLPRMSKARRNLCAVSRGESLFVFGGFNGTDGILFDSEMLDVRMKNWIKGPDVPPVLWNYSVA